MEYQKTTNQIRRGGIYYVHESNSQDTVGSETWSNRMGLVVSCEPNNKHSQVISIVYLTTSPKKKSLPTHIEVLSGQKKATALCEAIYSVDVSRLEDLSLNITEKEQQKVNDAIALGLNLIISDRPIGLFKKWENYIKHFNLMDEPQKTTSPIQEFQTLQKERDAYRHLYETTMAKLEHVQKLLQ